MAAIGGPSLQTIETSLAQFQQNVQKRSVSEENVLRAYLSMQGRCKAMAEQIRKESQSLLASRGESALAVIAEKTHDIDRIESALKNCFHSICTYYPTINIPEESKNVSRKMVSTRSPLRLPEGYGSCREISGDGNCFFTSFAVRLLETHIDSMDALIAQVRSKRVDVPGLQDAVENILIGLQHNPGMLESVFQDNHKMYLLVRFLREVAYQSMRSSPDREIIQIQLMADFPEKDLASKDYEGILQECVMQMGTDATEAVMGQLCSIFSLPVMVINQDGAAYTREIGSISQTSTQAVLIRKDRHYFIAYEADRVQVPVAQDRVGPMHVKVHYVAAAGETLYVRGNIYPLNWEKGHRLESVDGVTWEAKIPVLRGSEVEYKLLLNDQIWEDGENHRGRCGMEPVVPRFSGKSVIVEAHCVLPEGKILYVRGGKTPLTWDKGIPLYSMDQRTWQGSFSIAADERVEYKFLIDDAVWEIGENHRWEEGKTVYPSFS